MSPAFALTVGPLIVAWLAPALLDRAIGQVRDPLAVLLAWLGTAAAVLVTFTTGVALLLVPDTGPEPWMEHLGHHCWLALRHGRLPEADGIVGAAGAMAIIALMTRTATVAVRHWHAQRLSLRAHHDLLTLLGGTSTLGPEPVLRMPHSTPMAYSVGGRHGLMVVSDGVQQLPPAQLAAVLCHERAHLRGRHHLIVSLAEVLAAAAPWVPLTRRAPHAVRLLVELCADAVAVRTCGAAAVGGALIALTGAAHPAHALPMAGADVPIRLHRLQSTPPLDRMSARVALSLAALTAPAFVGLVAAVVFCA